jgi:hypothetical protein
MKWIRTLRIGVVALLLPLSVSLVDRYMEVRCCLVVLYWVLRPRVLSHLWLVGSGW